MNARFRASHEAQEAQASQVPQAPVIQPESKDILSK